MADMRSTLTKSLTPESMPVTIEIGVERMQKERVGSRQPRKKVSHCCRLGTEFIEAKYVAD